MMGLGIYSLRSVREIAWVKKHLEVLFNKVQYAAPGMDSLRKCQVIPGCPVRLDSGCSDIHPGIRVGVGV